MNDLPLISVIVPAFNAGDYIEKCITSITNQTYSNIQVIVINDGSTDGTKDIIDRLVDNDNRIVSINKDNTGVSDSRNVGLLFAEGEYIGFVDADDYIDSDMYEKLHKALVHHEAEIACCGYYQEFENHKYEICPERLILLESSEKILGQYMRQDIRNGIFDGNWNKLFSKSIVGEQSYKGIRYCEDVAFQIEVFTRCNKMVCIPDMSYHYVNNSSSATNSSFNDSKLSALRVVDDCLGMVKEKYPNILKQAYAFHLNWYLAIIQDIYNSKSRKRSVLVEKEIRTILLSNFKYYFMNKYSKRLDQILLVASCLGVTGWVLKIRAIVRKVLPSKDIIKK